MSPLSPPPPAPASPLRNAGAGRAALRTGRPLFRWVATWGTSVVSLVSGVLTLSLFRRGLEYLPWVIGYLLLLWLAGVVFTHVRDALAARKHRLALVAYDYVLQSLYWHLLLFLLPLYYVSTTLDSANVLFLLALGLATLLTAVDPWYRATILRHPWGASLLFGFTLFSSLNVALPLVGVPSGWTLVLAALTSTLALLPAVRRAFELPWGLAAAAVLTAALLAALGTWQVRRGIPPAPLQLVRGTFARDVRGLEPVDPIRRAAAPQARAWGSLACFTALALPARLQEPVVHVWHKDGAVVARIPLAPVRGGLSRGYRTYSRITRLGPDPAGAWSVDVLTAQGQLIGRIRLTIAFQ